MFKQQKVKVSVKQQNVNIQGFRAELSALPSIVTAHKFSIWPPCCNVLTVECTMICVCCDSFKSIVICLIWLLVNICRHQRTCASTYLKVLFQFHQSSALWAKHGVHCLGFRAEYYLWFLNGWSCLGGWQPGTHCQEFCQGMKWDASTIYLAALWVYISRHHCVCLL